MKWCSSCGQQLEDNAVACPTCGTAQPTATAPVAEEPVAAPVVEEKEDKGGFLWGLLGCCVPVVGLILFLVWKDDKPKSAKSAGTGALIGFIAGILFAIIYVVLVVALGVAIGGAGLYY